MASGKITKRTIDALTASRSEGFLWDDGIKGIGAKITKSGAVSYSRGDIYQRHDWKEEKRDALNLWNDHVAALLDRCHES